MNERAVKERAPKVRILLCALRLDGAPETSRQVAGSEALQ